MRISLKAEHVEVYREKIEWCISLGEFSWATLVEEIRTTKFIPKNWLSVRALLSQYIKAGVIVRTPDLSQEIYVSTNSGLGHL